MAPLCIRTQEPRSQPMRPIDSFWLINKVVQALRQKNLL
jgi:hypothetical protein